MKEETQKHLLAQIQENFKTFGIGQLHDHINKTALALQDEPLCFAAGVDVADVVKFVLQQAQMIGRGSRTPEGYQELRDACEKSAATLERLSRHCTANVKLDVLQEALLIECKHLTAFLG